MKYKLVKSGYNTVQYQPDELINEYPGHITNEKFVKTPEKYLREDDPSDPTNNVIKAKASSYMDYKLVP